MGQKRHHKLKRKDSAKNFYQPSFGHPLPASLMPAAIGFLWHHHQKRGVWQRGSDHGQHQFWKKDTACQGNQSPEGVPHQNGWFLHNSLQKLVNLSCPETIVEPQRPWLARCPKPNQIQCIHTPTSSSQCWRISPPMTATRSKAMDEDQGRVVRISQVAPVTTLSVPIPFVMRPPVDILQERIWNGDSLRHGGLGCGTKHWVRGG